MASADVSSDTPTQPPGIGTDMNLKVVTLPVADVDRAKSFYLSLGWLLQEISTRLPGREWAPATSVASLAQLLQETAEHRGHFEAVAPPHDWWDWYAAYMTARQAGSTPDEASASAGRYMAEVKHVVVPSA